MTRTHNRALTRIAHAAAALLLAGLAACVPVEEPPPPFRVEPYGPGLEVGTPGRRVLVEDRDGEVLAKVRLSRHSARIYDGDMNRLGRVTVADDHYALTDRLGQWRCDIGIGEREAQFLCEDGVGFSVSADGVGGLPGWSDGFSLVTEPNMMLQIDGTTVVAVESAEPYRITREHDHFIVRGRLPATAAMVLVAEPPDLEGAESWPLLQAAIAWVLYRMEPL